MLSGIIIETFIKTHMAENILQTFLNQQFIKTADGGNIESLKKAVAVVVITLTKTRKLIIPYTLVALDPQISELEPVVIEVEKIIIKTWPAFKNSTSTEDKATTYVRVVILQALSELVKNDQLLPIIWLTGRNIVSFYKTQKERKTMSELLIDMGSKFELASRKQWSLNELTITKANQLEITLPAIKSILIAETDLTVELKAAAIHSGWATQGGGGENPSHNAAGDWNWAKFFSERAGKGVAQVLNSALNGHDKAMVAIVANIQKGVNDYFTQFKLFFEEVSKAMNQSFSASNKRGDLLWWKQTLYSPFLNGSYRVHNDVTSAMAMAFDLSNLIGFMYPESANYLLREALRDIYGDTIDKPETFEFWLTKIVDISGTGREILKSLENLSEGRKPMGTALSNVFKMNSTESFESETGIELTQELSLADLAVWILHDLQAAKFANQK
jgi:hypothetical protein